MTDPTVVTNPDLAAQVGAAAVLLSQLVQFTSHLSTGAMTSHIIEWMKSRPGFGRVWNDLSDRAQVVACLVAAALPAAGITFVFIHPSDHPGQYGLMVDNLTYATLTKFAWSLAQNWVFQQGWYQTVIKPKPVTGVAPSSGPANSTPTPVPVTVKGVD